TPALKTEITAKGTADATLTDITGYADVLNTANISQETFKQSRSEVTTEAITAFNEVYDEAMAVAGISANFFKDQPDVQQQFIFTSSKFICISSKLIFIS